MNLREIAAHHGLSSEQSSTLDSLTFDLASMAKSVRKDEERIKLFVLAIARKEAEYAVRTALLSSSDLELARSIAGEAREFSLAAASLVRDWAVASFDAWKGVSLARLFGWDPFKELRQRTRAFAAKWDMDPGLRAALG
jgi:hypothetical protein